jgi:hypothetical protein
MSVFVNGFVNGVRFIIETNEVMAMEDCFGAKACPEDRDCGVSETQFPHVGKCCSTRIGTVGTEFTGVCPCCSIQKLPIDSSSLEIVTFFECTRHGYVRRVKGSTLLK